MEKSLGPPQQDAVPSLRTERTNRIPLSAGPVRTMVMGTEPTDTGVRLKHIGTSTSASQSPTVSS